MNSGNETLHPAVRDALLVERLDTLKTALGSVQAPAHLEETLVDEFRAQRARARRADRPRLWWMPPLAMMATLATVSVVSWMVRTPATLPVTQPTTPIAATADEPGPFLALRSLERIALEPQATVVAMEFPRALLAQWGLPVSPERADEPVRAEMLYSSEGEALAVRLLN